MKKKDVLKKPIRHVDVTAFDATPIIAAMREMSFTSRDTAAATDIFSRMLRDKGCTIVLSLAGSTSAAGCMQIYADMIRHNMVDVVVATGASIVAVDDRKLRELYIDRIYDTFIDEEQLQACDMTVKQIADRLPPKPYSSREFIREMGRYLTTHAVKKGSLVELAYRHNVPIFCPAFTDSSAGFGLVKHQVDRPDRHLTLDAIRDFYELTRIKMEAKTTGIFMIGGGVPKNFVQDTVICAEVLGKEVPMHKYAVQITVADARDGACSSSTLKEASSWGKVDTTFEQMVFAEATSVLPLIVSCLYHQKDWKKRKRREWSKLFA